MFRLCLLVKDRKAAEGSEWHPRLEQEVKKSMRLPLAKTVYDGLTIEIYLVKKKSSLVLYLEQKCFRVTSI